MVESDRRMIRSSVPCSSSMGGFSLLDIQVKSLCHESPLEGQVKTLFDVECAHEVEGHQCFPVLGSTVDCLRAARRSERAADANRRLGAEASPDSRLPRRITPWVKLADIKARHKNEMNWREVIVDDG